MKKIFGLFAMLAVLTPLSAISAAIGAPTDVSKPVNGVLASLTNCDSQRLTHAYASDAVVVDEQSPYEWSGRSAGSDWISALCTYGKLRDAQFRAVGGGPANVRADSGGAYVTIHGVFTGVGARSGFRDDGRLVFVLRKISGDWKIASQTWVSV